MKVDNFDGKRENWSEFEVKYKAELGARHPRALELLTFAEEVELDAGTIPMSSVRIRDPEFEELGQQLRQAEHHLLHARALLLRDL